MKKLLSILTAAALTLAFAACADKPAAPEPAETAAQLPNPVADVADASAFAPLGVAIDAPQGAEDVSCSIIADKIAQILFAYGGRGYTYRAATADEDISGVYETFDDDALSTVVDADGYSVEVTTRTIGGGANGALAAWTCGAAQYTLYTGDAVNGNDVAALAALLAASTAEAAAATAAP